MPKKKIYGGSSIGELYGKISVSGQDFSSGGGKLVKETIPPFVRLCKKLWSFSPSMGKNAKFSPENKSALDYLGWKLEP
ncbi:MAG: hypothetical protein NUV57_02345, partial [archaeon]|nr:hypothetical protein [archaeon]